jgi:tetratricopeptide (TPR) repeat protein
MGIFSFLKRDKFNGDYIAEAEKYEAKGDFGGAIVEYEKMIQAVYADKEPKHYRHVIKRIVADHVKMGNLDVVFEMWPKQYDPSDYGAKEMYELIKILESGQRLDLVMKIYDMAGKKLLRNKMEFMIRLKKIPEANALMNELLMTAEANPEISVQAIKELWITKAKLCLSLKKWDEANKYINKVLEKDPHNMEVRKLKDFCLKQVRMS